MEDKNLVGKPLLIVLNKIDLEPRFTQEEIKKHLNLDYITDRPWVVVPVSALHGTNVVKVVDWLLKYSS